MSQNDATFDPTLAQMLQTTLDKCISTDKFIGASAAVLLPGNKIWLGTSGYSVPASRDTISPDMLFGLGSITNTYTTAMMLKLVDEGVVSLDDPLSDWIERYVYVDPSITIQQILQHTSGVFNYTNHPKWFEIMLFVPRRHWSPEETLNSFLLAPTFSPGTSWSYSNTGFIIAGMVVKQASGMEVTTYLHSNFLNPQNLTHTFLEAEDTLHGRVVHYWYDIDGDGDLNDMYSYPRTAIYSSAWTAGAMMATAEDVAKWASLLYAGTFFSPELLDEMLSFYDLTYFAWTGYGLGTMRFKYYGKTLWGHGGSIPGFNSSMFYLPEDSVSFVVLLNSNSNAEYVNSLLLKTYLDYKETGINTDSNPIAGDFKLFQNYPNPFNPMTTIEYDLPRATDVEVAVFNSLGQKIKNLVKGKQAAGRHQTTWNGQDNAGHEVSSGVYFYKLRAGNFVQVKKMILLR
jgi:D-alanyl-D-alanine carboxypeptidase